MIFDQEKGTFELKIMVHAGFLFEEKRSIMQITFII